MPRKDGKRRPYVRCSPHAHGAPAWLKVDSYFTPGCAQCEAKRQKGVVTGKEPTPGEVYEAHWRVQRSATYKRVQARNAGIRSGRIKPDTLPEFSLVGRVV